MIAGKVKIFGVAQLRYIRNFNRKLAGLRCGQVIFDRTGAVVAQSDESDSPIVESLRPCAVEYLAGSPTEAALIAQNRAIAMPIRLGDDINGAALLYQRDGAEINAGIYEYLKQILACLVDGCIDAGKSEQQIELVSEELSHTYEELALLYKMGTNMQVNQSDSAYLQLACDSLCEIIQVQGIAVVLDKRLDNSGRLMVTAGAGIIPIQHDEFYDMFEVIYDRLTEQIEQGKEALLDSEIDGAFKYEWPRTIQNIIAVPLSVGEKNIGFMIAVNRIGKPDFDSVDMKIFRSVANECAVFVENGNLFEELKLLFLGSLKALTNSIDAKDKYTRGHSERVAYISRWLAENYAKTNPLEEEQIQRIYLSGLLHDIGKIGIPEAVLCKEGPLTDEEFRKIKAHPVIGAGILAEIPQMKDIIPGILCHHERCDGRGYPNHLKGDEIPLAGKIVMLADTFDAMTSRRSYRSALSLQVTLGEIEKNLGTQFDPVIGRLFLDSDVNQLWQILQDECIESIYTRQSWNYGSVAIGALIR